MAENRTKMRPRRGRTLKTSDGQTIRVRKATLATAEERRAAIRRAAGSIKTDVLVDASYYRSRRGR